MWNKIFLVVFFLSCSSRPDDPLKNTKKLIKEGHASLYENGAFAIPSTKIKLIPPGPDAVNLAKELTGLKAKESFLNYLNEIKNSTVVIFEGTKSSYKFASKVDKAISGSLSGLGSSFKENSIVIMDSSLAKSKGIIGKSWVSTKEVNESIQNLGRSLGKSLRQVKLNQGEFAGIDKFILGYVKLPDKLERRKNKISESVSLKKFVENFKGSEEFRKESSDLTTYLIKDSFKDYADDIDNSFTNASSELNKGDEFGYTFVLLRSLRWVLDGILWQGIAKPLGKFSAGAVGYTISNGVIYPIYIFTSSGLTSAQIAVEVVRQTGSGIFELSAPTVELAISSILHSGEYLMNKTIEKASHASGFVLGKSLEYIGAPLGATVIGTTDVIRGVAVGMGGGILAGSTRGSGEILSLSSKVISKSAGAVTFAGGVVAHTLKGTGELVYEVTKASVVPPGMILGSGLALSYGTVSQLAAQSVLAVSDAAYLVLSLEGPNWVVYAINGKLGDRDLPEGTVLDLEKMQSAGEEIRKVPVTQDEVKRVIEYLNDDSKR